MSSPKVIYALVGVLALCSTGCGEKLVPVQGVVKLDGAPVAGATVTFQTEDGARTYSGHTDEGGNFSLVSGTSDRPGVPPGTYKALVVKNPKVEGAENMTPGSADYTKQMQKEAKEAAKSGTPKTPMPGMMRPGSMSGPPGVKSQLPAVYASATTTPFTIQVPTPDGQPVQLDLKAKP